MYRLLQAVCSYGFYQTVHNLTENYLVTQLDKKLVENLDLNDRLDLPEKIPSTINGLLIGSLGLYLIFWEKAFDKDIVNSYPVLLDFLFASFVGYTVYDLKVMWSKPKEEFSMWVHHILGFVGSSLILIFQHCAFFPVLFCITEITVVPSNLVWFLQRFELKASSFYTIALAFRAAAFLSFRTFITPFCYYYAVNNPGPYDYFLKELSTKYPKVSLDNIPSIMLNSLSWDEKQRILRHNLFQLPSIVPVLCISFAGIFGILNIIWSFVIFKNFIARLQKPKSKKKKTI